jgi:hypothetical protein
MFPGLGTCDTTESPTPTRQGDTKHYLPLTTQMAA